MTTAGMHILSRFPVNTGIQTFLLVFLVCCCQGQRSWRNDETTEEYQFRQSVLDSYDPQATFADNFYSILGMICEESVYCIENGTLGRNISWEAINNTEVWPTDTTRSYNQTRVSESREYLRHNNGKLRGCCYRCSCDNHCFERNNCCPEHDYVDKQYATESESRVMQACVDANIESYTKPRTLPNTKSIGASYYMVTDCFAINVSVKTFTKCRKPNVKVPPEITPVYSPSSERIYKNRFCAECNGDNQVIPWKSVIFFNRLFSLTGLRPIPSSPEALYGGLRPSLASLIYMPPDNMPADITKYECLLSNPSLATGKENTSYDETNFLKRACAARHLKYTTPNLTFNNVFCFLLSCKIFGEAHCYRMNRKIMFSFTAVLDGDFIQSAEDDTGADIVGTGTPCKCSEYFDDRKKSCRKIMCPPGEKLGSCACVPFLKNVTNMPSIAYLEIIPKIEEIYEVKRFGVDIKHNTKPLQVKLNRFMKANFRSVETKDSLLFLETSVSDKSRIKVHAIAQLSIKGTVDNRKIMKKMFEVLRTGVHRDVLDIPMEISLGWIFDIHQNSNRNVEELHGLINDDDVVIKPLGAAISNVGPISYPGYKYSQVLSKLVYCKRVKLDDGEIGRIRNNSIPVTVPHKLMKYIYQDYDGSMCIDEFEEIFLNSTSCSLLNKRTLANFNWCALLLMMHRIFI